MTETTQEERQLWASTRDPDSATARLIRDADRLAKLEDGIRALAVKFDRAAVAYRKEGLNGQAELWDLAADRTRALLDGE